MCVCVCVCVCVSVCVFGDWEVGQRMAQRYECRENEGWCLPALKLHGDEIKYVPRYSYLGAILEHRMNWKPHVEILRDKGHGSLAALSSLQRSSLPSRAKLLIYKTCIRHLRRSGVKYNMCASCRK